jgi:hypothetical protein
VGDRGVPRLVHADRGDAEAVEAGVAPGQPIAYGREIGEIREGGLAQLGMGETDRRAGHREHLLDVLRQQAFAHDALPDHAGRSEDHNLHRCTSDMSDILPSARLLRSRGAARPGHESVALTGSENVVRRV